MRFLTFSMVSKIILRVCHRFPNLFQFPIISEARWNWKLSNWTFINKSLIVTSMLFALNIESSGFGMTDFWLGVKYCSIWGIFFQYCGTCWNFWVGCSAQNPQCPPAIESLESIQPCKGTGKSIGVMLLKGCILMKNQRKQYLYTWIIVLVFFPCLILIRSQSDLMNLCLVIPLNFICMQSDPILYSYTFTECPLMS